MSDYKLIACDLDGTLYKTDKTVSDENKKETVMDNIFNRKSVRQYTAEPVSDADLQTLLKAAMAAPSAKNRQPWRFIVVNEREVLDSLAEGLPFAKMLKKAPVAIVVCVEENRIATINNNCIIFLIVCHLLSYLSQTNR